MDFRDLFRHECALERESVSVPEYEICFRIILFLTVWQLFSLPRFIHHATISSCPAEQFDKIRAFEKVTVKWNAKKGRVNTGLGNFSGILLSFYLPFSSRFLSFFFFFPREYRLSLLWRSAISRVFTSFAEDTGFSCLYFISALSPSFRRQRRKWISVLLGNHFHQFHQAFDFENRRRASFPPNNSINLKFLARESFVSRRRISLSREKPPSRIFFSCFSFCPPLRFEPRELAPSFVIQSAHSFKIPRARLATRNLRAVNTVSHETDRISFTELDEDFAGEIWKLRGSN